MDLLNNYFNSLTFYYIEEKQKYAIYGASIHSMLAGDKQRYVLAFVPSHLGIQRTAKLSELPWINIQMRLCLKTTYRLKPQVWKIPQHLPNLTFTAVDRTNTYTKYQSNSDDFPFEVLMIHTPKKKSIYQYPNVMNMHWAIDQFDTVFNYIGTVAPIQLTTLPALPQHPVPPPVGNPMKKWFENTQNSSDFEFI